MIGSAPVDMDYTYRKLRMQMLVVKCHLITPDELKELLQLRFGADNLKGLKRFMLRVHPDKVGNDVCSDTCHLWMEAVNCAQCALRATPHDFPAAIRRLSDALEPLYHKDTPPPLSNTAACEEDASSDEGRVWMPTRCVFCNEPALVCEVLSASKYAANDAVARRLANQEWQHADCAKKNRMSKRHRPMGPNGLEGTERCALRECFVDCVTGAEIRKKCGNTKKSANRRRK